MDSAEGQVQNLQYTAAFPLLLNISDQPTYFMALKDGAGLVKKYAMVNVQKYQNVAIGDTVQECEKNYEELLESSGIDMSGASENDLTAQGVIYRMAQAVLDGNSHFYITLEGQDQIFDVPVIEFPEIVGYDLGDQISLRYVQGDRICTVTQLEGQEPQKDSSDPEDDQGESQDTEETEAS